MDCPDHLGQPIGKFSLMRPTALATGLAGIAVVGILLAMGASSLEKNPASGSGGIFADLATREKTTATATAPVVADATETTATVATDAKTVTPDSNKPQTTPPAPPPIPQAAAPVIDPANPPPAQPPGDTKPANTKTIELKSVDLGRITAENAGVLVIGDKKLQLAGVVPTDPNQICTGPNGKEWPCGTIARTALRAFLRSRAITCDLPSAEWQGTVTATCRFVKTDLSDWLARNGWAQAVVGSSLVAAGDEARKNNRGIYGDDPRKDRASTLAPPPVQEDPLNPI
jgi:endonuclease YncB( thermonuclease family)